MSDSATPWTVALGSSVPGILQARTLGAISGQPFPSPGDLPDPGVQPGFSALRAHSLPSEPPAKCPGHCRVVEFILVTWAGAHPTPQLCLFFPQQCPQGGPLASQQPDKFSSVQSLSRVRLFVTPWTAALQASLSITNSQSLLKLMSIESVMPSSHLILCCPLLLPPSIFPSIRVFSNESVLIRWPKY